MTTFAFAGPSLPKADRAAFPDVVWLPPCEAGDVLRLAPGPRDTVCIIDGWFDHRPAVRHKEILLALSNGARVLGSSSIGALRAAEMIPCGMVGIGRIFRAFASGRLTGDDEVALVHAPEAWDWRPFSVPLVDVRATLERAVRNGAVAPDEARRLMGSARQVHYVDRNWPSMLEQASLAPRRRTELLAWLDRQAVSQKILDARACMAAAMAKTEERGIRPVAVMTTFLEVLIGQSRQPPRPAAQAPGR